MPAITVMAQLFQSLFLTGDKPGHKINPFAIILLSGAVAVSIIGYYKITSLMSELEIARQARVVLDSSNDKVEKLNEARNEQEKSNSYAGTDAWHDWADRLQDGD